MSVTLTKRATRYKELEFALDHLESEIGELDQSIWAAEDENEFDDPRAEDWYIEIVTEREGLELQHSKLQDEYWRLEREFDEADIAALEALDEEEMICRHQNYYLQAVYKTAAPAHISDYWQLA